MYTHTQGVPHQARVDFHKGETIVRLAGTYPTLQQVIKEQVQNALDSEATWIQVCMNLKSRTYLVLDNGKGASTEYFERALQSVGMGIKSKDKLGRFGLGLISPLGKCDRFTFTSCPQPYSTGFTEWTLDTREIRGQKEELLIPRRTRTDLAVKSKKSPERGVTQVWWRTQVAVQGFTNDKILSSFSIDAVEQGILDDFSEVMLKRGVKVVLELTDEKGVQTERVVQASEFTGKPLRVASYEEKDSGTTQFRMYLVRKSGNKGNGKVNIKFGEMRSDFRFSFASFSRSNAAELLSKETLDGLRSGIFEGEILSEKAELHPTRKSFELSDALMGLCTSIDRWFAEVGKKYLNDERERRSSERYQELGMQSMKAIEEMLHLPENADLLKVIRSGFAYGSIGIGHAKPETGQVNGPQDRVAQALRGGVGKERAEGSGKSSSPPKREYQGHTPLSVQGPQGQLRRLVRGNSLGLQFAYEDFGASPDLWRLDYKEGVLMFNITHPLWVECDKERKDWKVRALQEHVAMQALTLETMPDRAWYDHQRLFADEYTKRFVQLLSVGAISKSIRTS